MNKRPNHRDPIFNSFVSHSSNSKKPSQCDKTLLQVQVFLQTLSEDNFGPRTLDWNKWMNGVQIVLVLVACVVSFHFTCSIARSVSQDEISVSSCKVTLPTPNAECMHGGGGAVRPRPSVRPSHAVECQDKLLRPIFRHSAAGATDSLGTRGWHVPRRHNFIL